MSYRRNGYKMIYLPTHPRAGQDGMVYEHVYIAEQKLGRVILLEEDVHHIDEDKSNNAMENLIVFKTHEDHSRYHKTGIMTETEDGTYISPQRMNICKQCNTEYAVYRGNDTFCSKECFDVFQRKADRPSKEELTLLIMNKSFVQIGKEFGVSDNAVRKWCKIYNLPFKRKDLKIWASMQDG